METWIETGGSPFVIIESQYAHLWDIHANYKKVCGVQGYIGMVRIKNYNAVVLRDEPMPIRVMSSSNNIVI